MTGPVTFSNQALRRLQEIRAYHAATASEQVVRRFVQEVEAVRPLIAAVPGGGRPTRRTVTRVLRLARFPYLVFYKAVPDGELGVLQVRHARRRPLRLS